MRVRNLIRGRWSYVGLALSLVLLIAVLAGCQGTTGPSGLPGSPGTAGVSTGTLSGKVTNSLTGSPLTGVKITTEPAIQGVNITTDAAGAYTASLPIGTYNVSFSRDNFVTAKDTAMLVSGQTQTKNMVLQPAKPVAVNAGSAQSAAPGASVTLKAMAEPLDGSAISGYQWTQVDGVPVTISNAKSDTITFTLGKASDYKAALVKSVVTEDRFGVMAINPHVLTGANTANFKVTVTTSSGSYSGTVAVTIKLPYEITSGIQNVPQGVPVILHGKNQGSYGWTISGPAGSKADLDEPGGQNPAFTPDMVGKYVITEKNSNITINVYAGTWAGAITGMNSKGQPLAAACITCHNDKTAPDKFTSWMQTGHSQIFTKNIENPQGHWNLTCAECHTVGYNPDVKNGGFDEAATEENWKVPSHGEVGYWKMMLEKYPKSARLANIQCENCHGPNNGSTLHANGTVDAARISISSDLCGSCHGEPLRHGRFQQWETSGHANYEVAIEEATVENRGATAGHCGRCHSAQGFLTWIEQSDLTKQIQGKNGNATVDELKAIGLTKDTVHPQTCTVCHNPHSEGASSGEPSTATVRISGSTSLLPAGFKAENVGRGAICMTCHNTRNGTHNDSNPPANYNAPHVAAQADVVMGENAYFIGDDRRSPHGAIKDTCVTCHMEATPPPPEFSFEGSGTNHSFKASPSICGTCHTPLFDGKAFQTSYEERIQELGITLATYLFNKLPANVTIIDYTPHTFSNISYDLKSVPLTVSKDNISSVSPLEVHGQQSFVFKLKSPLTFTYQTQNSGSHTQSISEAQVQLGDITSDGKSPVIAVSDVLVRAGWNYYLVHSDSSKGVHNPEFIKDMLEATEQALK